VAKKVPNTRMMSKLEAMSGRNMAAPMMGRPEPTMMHSSIKLITVHLALMTSMIPLMEATSDPGLEATMTGNMVDITMASTTNTTQLQAQQMISMIRNMATITTAAMVITI